MVGLNFVVYERIVVIEWIVCNGRNFPEIFSRCFLSNTTLSQPRPIFLFFTPSITLKHTLSYLSLEALLIKMLPLPEIKGPYEVGATTFYCKPSPLTIGTAKVRSPSGELVDLLRLDEVVYTAYYPADTGEAARRSAGKGVPWLQRHVVLHLGVYR